MGGFTRRVVAWLLTCLLLTVVQVRGQQFVEQLLLRPLEDGNVLTHAQFTVSLHRAAGWPCSIVASSISLLRWVFD